MYPDTITIVDTISAPAIASLLSIHPNDVTPVHHQRPSHWSTWWTWASDYAATQPGQPPAWLQLMHYLTRPRDDEHPSADIPAELRSLVDAVRVLQLQRTPSVYETCPAGDRSYRISPKKVHEIDRMSSYIRHMVHSESPRAVWHAVDVGSGQGYLSRALQELDFHVLALDNNEHQTSGASQWTTKETARKLKRDHRSTLNAERKPSGHPRIELVTQEDTGQLQSRDVQIPNSSKGSLTHRTVHVSPRTLEESIAEWLVESPGTERSDGPDARQKPIPIMLVALHACGSLTVDVLRTFLSDWSRARRLREQDARAWTPYSLVVVGCCYNLMSPSDFPLSKPLRSMDPTPKLTIPARRTRDAELALRKVVYRALLQPVLQAVGSQLSAIDHETLSEHPIQPGLGETQENRRLGKLNNKAYQDWHTFLEHATSKLGIDLVAISSSLPEWFTNEAVRLKMESALFVLQTLRCILGPLIETLILLDRRDWIQHELTEMNDCGQEVEVEMVNLFDQATGSGRNVALVIKPATIPRGTFPMIERN
ncbi:hypothetical protein JVU11DRAFT_3154 [Chiua virens]|nr:hypothetical protein JVU11DRAFT_3154 [Chiua virens]